MRINGLITLFVLILALFISCNSSKTIAEVDDDEPITDTNIYGTEDEEDEEDNFENEEDNEDDADVRVVTTPITIPGPLSAGRLLASQCAQCHGTDGVSSTDIDSLAGESKAEIIDEMLDMKYDDDNDMMHLQAHGYTEEQIELIAEYFSQIDKPSDNDEEED